MALIGMFIILGAYICAGWMGFELGVEHAERKARTKRGIRRG